MVYIYMYLNNLNEITIGYNKFPKIINNVLKWTLNVYRKLPFSF